MATIRAIASGNWSAPSTWNGSILPGNGDTVYSNGFTVTIDQDLTIGGANNPSVNAGSFVSGQWYEITSVGTTNFTTIGASANTIGVTFIATGAGSGTGTAKALATLTTATNTPAGATTGGGVFTMPAAYNVSADIVSGTTSCLTATHSTGTISITNSRVIGGGSSGAQGVVISGAGAVNFSTSTFTSGAGGGGISYAVNLSGSATVTISGGVLVSPTSTAAVLANTSATGTLSVSGVTTNLVWNSGITNTGAGSTSIANSTLNAGTNPTSYGAVNTSTGTLTITGSTITASSSASGVLNSSTGTLNCSTCTFTAANGFNAVSSTNANANNRFSGTFVSSTNGTQAIYAPKWILNTTPLTSYIQHSLDGINPNSFVRFYTADNSLGQANPTDVRSGVTYASGNLTGRLTVPARGSVALSVNYGPSMLFTATRSGTTATATLAYSYPYQVGDVITVTGASNPEWNGSYTIATVVSGSSITFDVPASHSATAGTGATMQTTGTAILTADAVWNTLASSMTTSGSIGERLKNCATTQSTGDQLASLL